MHPTTSLPPRLDRGAIASVVFGAIGLAFPFVFAILAIVLAGRAHERVDHHGGRRADRDLASVGSTLGWCGVAIGAMFVAFVVVALMLGATFGAETTTTTTTF